MEFELKHNVGNFILEINDDETITSYKIDYLDASKDFKNYFKCINPTIISKIGNLLNEMIQENNDLFEYDLLNLTTTLYENLSQIDKQNFKEKIEED